jgi:hypothetical protein
MTLRGVSGGLGGAYDIFKCENVPYNHIYVADCSSITPLPHKDRFISGFLLVTQSSCEKVAAARYPRRLTSFLSQAIDRQTSRAQAITMTAPLPKRIIKETERLQTEPVPGISAHPHEDNARYFDVMVQGPDGSCYEGGYYSMVILNREHRRLM